MSNQTLGVSNRTKLNKKKRTQSLITQLNDWCSIKQNRSSTNPTKSDKIEPIQCNLVWVVSLDARNW